jgi:hypothetical protein
LLVDVPVAFLWLLTIYFFFEAYLKSKSWKYFILPGIFLGLAFLMKFSSIVLVILLAIYLFITEREKIFKNLRIYVFYICSLLTITPYLLWQKIKFGSFFAFYTASRGGEGIGKDHPFLESLFNQAGFVTRLLDPYMLNSPSFYFPILGALFLLGVGILCLYLVMLPERIGQKGTFQNKGMFLFLWAILSMLFFGWLNYGEYMDERYYFIFYPALFLFIAYATDKIYVFFSKKKKFLALGLLILLFVFAGYTNLSHTNNIVRVKSVSFVELRQAGEFLKENIPEGGTFVAGEAVVELIYYSERQVNLEGDIHNKTDLLNKIEELDASYLVLPMYYYLGPRRSDGHIEVVNYVFTNRDLFIPAASFGPAVDQNGQIPLVSIFKINN